MCIPKCLQVLYLCVLPQGCVGTGEPLLQRYRANQYQQTSACANNICVCAIILGVRSKTTIANFQINRDNGYNTLYVLHSRA